METGRQNRNWHISSNNNSFDISLYRKFLYTSHAGFIFIWGISVTPPLLASFLSGEFLLHIPCWLLFYLGSFSYTSRAGFIFIWGVSLTHPMLATFLSACWLHFYLGSFSYTSRAGFIFIWGVFLTHPMLAGFFCGELLLHILCSFFLSFFFLSLMWRNSSLHIPCWLYFYLGSFSYTAHADLTFYCWEFLLHIP